jgi:hypothetical protein
MNEKKLIDPLWTETLRHTLGAEKHIPKSQHGYRNYYCDSVGTMHHQMLLAMVDAGLMTAGSKINSGANQYFHATLAGCEAIGLDKSAIDRAFSK